MKQCPVCKSLVNSKSECPICGNTVTYEPTVMFEKEHIVWNKYSWLYYLKNIWFSALSIVTGLVVCFISKFDMGYLFFLGGFCALISLFVSLFHRKLASYMTWKYSEDYIPYRIGALKYTTGAVAIMLFIVWLIK